MIRPSVFVKHNDRYGFALSNFFAGNPATSADTFQPYESVEQVPDSVQELWKGFDPEAEALDTEIVKEWVKDGVTTRYLTFNVLNFQGTPSRIAAYYCFPFPRAPSRLSGPTEVVSVQSVKGVSTLPGVGNTRRLTSTGLAAP